MAEPALKLAPKPDSKSADAAPKRRIDRKRLRLILLVAVPLIAAVGGLMLYLAGGRYISTDNAYVGSQKVLITTDIAGKIAEIKVREGQHVAAGDELFAIDAEPFRLTLAQAQGRLAMVATDFANLKTNLKSLGQLVELARRNAELKQHDVDRKTTLFASRSGAQADVDTAAAGLVAAQNQVTQLTQQEADISNQLLGNPDLPVAQYPPYQQAKAALDQAQRDLDHTVLRAPIAGTATQVDNIQLGRYVAAGTPVFSVVDDAAPWVDANPKETDITYLRVGEPATVTVDTFPGRVFRGTVLAVSPGTGAQFAILPPQNASGNWVKVVQRVPLRIAFDKGEDVSQLRSGMSANVDIDSGRKRSLATLLGFSSAAQETRP